MNKKYIIFSIIIIFLIAILSFVLPLASSKYTETVKQELTLNINEPQYKIIFNSNNGTGTMNPQIFTYSIAQNLTSNSFIRDGYAFINWNTKQDGSGTTYTNGQSVSMLSDINNYEITLYAQWQPAVAKIGNTIYTSLQAAIDAVPTTNIETTVELLTNVSENLVVSSNKNINFDLKNYTVSVDNGALLTNNGTVKINNGNLISNSVTDGAVNNQNNATLIVNGGSVIMNNPKGKQAIYNDGGTVTISGTAYIRSESDPHETTKYRAAVQNNKGTMYVTGGTIISPKYLGLYNKQTLTIGIKDGNVSNTSPVIQGATLGVSSDTNFSFYDGIVKGVTNAFSNENKITDREIDYNILHSTEVIDNVTYKTAYLGNSKAVTFNPNGGTVSEPTRGVITGNEVGPLPTPAKSGFRFDGWFTELNGGTQITEHEIINNDVTFYAHWTEIFVAELDGTLYHTIKEAVAQIPANNVQKTINVLENSTENIVTHNNQNIVINFDGHTLTYATKDRVIENSGTLELINGTITSDAEFAAIDNVKNGNLIINGMNITASNSRQTVYSIDTSTVTITGNSVLRSRASGLPTGTQLHLHRGTVQGGANATINIVSGTIIGEVGYAVSNEGVLNIGTSGDNNIDITNPNIQGETHAINSTGTVNFYDGILKGITDIITNGTITTTESNTTLTDGTEVIDGKTYKTKYLVANP